MSSDLTESNRAVLELMDSVKAKQKLAMMRVARLAFERDERALAGKAYVELARLDSLALGRRMVRMAMKPHTLPFNRTGTVLSASRSRHSLFPLASRTIVTPLLFESQPEYVDSNDIDIPPLALTMGWRFTTAVIVPGCGNAKYRYTHSGIDGICIEEIVRNPETDTDIIGEVHSFKFHGAPLTERYKPRPLEDIQEPNADSYIEQFGLLRAARIAIGDKTVAKTVAAVLEYQ